MRHDRRRLCAAGLAGGRSLARGPIGARAERPSLLAVEDHARVIKHAADKLPVGSEAGVVPVEDVVAVHLIAPLIGAFPIAASFIIAAVREQGVADIPLGSD